MRTAQCVWILSLAILGGAACHTRPPATAPARSMPAPSAVPARPPAPPRPPAAAPAPAARPLSDEEVFERTSLSELNAQHPLADAFFDYNENVLRDDARASLQRDAQWLRKWPRTKVKIEGHCDERGSAEYNLALGDRRAETVRDYLTTLGVTADRIEITSVGKEAPFCSEASETCWSQNRRGHFVITAK